MIALKISHGFLELSPNTSITLELINPLFANEMGGNSHSYSFSFEATSHNQLLLERANVIQKVNRSISIEVRLYLFGLYWKTGQLTFSKATHEQYQGALKIETGDMASRFADRALRASTLGGIRPIANPQDVNPYQEVIDHANATTTATIDSSDYVFFPVYNPAFYTENLFPSTTPDHEAYMNFWSEDSFNNEVAAELDQGIEGGYNLVPFPYALYVLRNAIEEAGYELSSSILTDAELQKLVIWNNQALDKAYPFQVLNAYLEYNLHRFQIDLREHVPDISLRDFISGWMGNFCLAAFTTGKTLELIPRKEVLASAAIIDWSDKCLVGAELDLEEGKGYTLFAELDGSDALHASDAYRSYVDSKAVGEVETFGDLPNSTELGQIYYVRFENSFYRNALKENLQTEEYEWIFEAFRLEGVTIGEGGEKFNAKASTLQIYADPWETSGTSWRIPRAEHPGSSDLYQQGQQPFDLRFLFYRGLKEDGQQQGKFYPQGSPDNLTDDEYSLFWYGRRGLFEIWWKAWIEFLEASEKLSYPLELTPHDLRSLAWKHKYRFLTPEGYVNAFIAKLTVQLNTEEIQSVQAQLYTT